MTFEYAQNFGGATGIPLECGENTYTNIASLATDDTETLTSTEIVTLNVECEGPGDGCTLTQGYWKTHSLRGPCTV